MKRLWIALSLAVLLLSFNSNRLAGQATPGSFADANHPAGPPDPEKDSQIWQVDPISDQVSITVPFTTEPQGGRGPKIPFSLLYNSGSTVTLQALGSYSGGAGAQDNVLQWSTYPLNVPLTSPSGPWTTSGPYLNSSETPNVADYTENPTAGDGSSTGQTITFIGCTMNGPYVYVDAGGASHDLNLIWFQWNDGYSQTNPPPNPMPVCEAAAGSFYGASSTPYWPTSSTVDGSTLITSANGVIEPDGTSVNYNPANGAALTDANGNAAILSAPNSTGSVTATDALGRTIYTTNIPIGLPGQIPAGTYTFTTYGATGAAENYTVVFSTETLGSFPAYPGTNVAMPHPNPASEIGPQHFCLAGGCTQVQNYGVNQPGPGPSQQTTDPIGTFTAVTSISLPDGTSQYTFSYDPIYGTISKITFPTGGYIRFVWAVRDKDWTPYGQYEEISSIVVTDAYESPTGSASNEYHWGYTPNNSHIPESLSTSATPIGYVYAPDGSYTYYTGQCNFNFDVISYFNIGPRPSCKENSHVNYSSGGTVLASEVMLYNPEGLTVQDASTLYGGANGPEQKQTVYYYDGYNNVVEKDESDYSPSCTLSGGICQLPSQTTGTWLRRTFTSYEPSTAFAGTNIVDKPYQVLITDANMNPGNSALTTYGYNAYGNVTSESKCTSTPSFSASTTAHTLTNASCTYAAWTQYTVDSTGQVTSSAAGYGSSTSESTSYPATSYTWGGQGNGYLMSVQHPNGATDAYTYSSYTGQVLTHADWNNKPTTYAYNDYLNRVTQIVPPTTTDGTTGQPGNATTGYTYTDTPGAFTVLETHAIEVGTGTSVTTTFDGLGRKIKAVAKSPQCTSGIETDTSYDSMSRVSQVSNPYCTTSDPTYGLTIYAYDGLSRKIQTTLPDGSVATDSYAGRATKIVDPSNFTTTVTHIQQVDGLGRLVSVCEVAGTLGGGTSGSQCTYAGSSLDIAGTGYATTYGFIPLGDMVSVNQSGLARSFSYDSLSRLTQSLNPEAGQDQYTYSTPGASCAPDPTVPCTRTDARGVVTHYTYDNMSRLIAKSYSTSDLASCYQYDHGIYGYTDDNPWGQLTAEWQQANCPLTAASPYSDSIPSGAVAPRIFSQHDAMGRAGYDQQCLNGASCSSTVGNFLYSYNLAGGIAQSNNGIAWDATADTGNTGTITIAGTEAGPINEAAISGSGTLTVSGSDGTHEVCTTVNTCEPSPSACNIIVPITTCTGGIPDTGSISVALDGFEVGESYQSGTTDAALAQGFVSGFNNSGSPVTATYNGSNSFTLKAKATGPSSDYPITFSDGDYSVTDPNSTLMGGQVAATNAYDTGTMTAVVTMPGGATYTTVAVSWGQGSTPTNIATALASALNSVAGSVLTATSSGGTVSLASADAGVSSVTVSVVDTQAPTYPYIFPSPSFTASGGNMSGSSSSSMVTQNLVFPTTTLFSNVSSSSAPSLTWMTKYDQMAHINNTYVQDQPQAWPNSGQGAAFSVFPSPLLPTSYDPFGHMTAGMVGVSSAAPSGAITIARQYDNRARLTSDTETGYGNGVSYNAYSYSVPSGGYAANGDILEHVDSVTGTWKYRYDSVDRLVTAQNLAATTVASQYANMYGCWSYDPYGNRTGEQMITGSGFTNGFDATCTPASGTKLVQSTWGSVGTAGNNRFTSTNFGATTYDASGNTESDGRNQYWYDAEGHLCAEQTGGTGGPITAYVYDAGGARIAKGTLTAAPAAGAVCAPVTASGSSFTSSLGFSMNTTGARYLVDLGGQQVTELNGSGTWAHSNMFAGGKLVGTYDTRGLHYALSDPLGTKRVQVNIAGEMDEYCTSLPFGNDINNPYTPSCVQTPNQLNTQDDATEHHFTQKERDIESGNDYFFARYYTSAIGRFITPDWSAKAVPVPYAVMDDPQSLNLYGYVRNNPLVRIDSDGHGIDCSGKNASGVGCQAIAEWDKLHGIYNNTVGRVVSYVASTVYAKTQIGFGLGGEFKVGPAKIKVELKDVTETRVAKVGTRTEVIDAKASLKFGPVEVGLGATGEKPLQTDKVDAPFDAKTEWTPVIGFNYKSLSTDSHGWDTGVGAAGCVVICLGLEGGVDAGKVVSDGINTVKQAWSAMDAQGPIY
jgi:RHS repeat-associated protein